jgi:hypothetical protein
VQERLQVVVLKTDVVGEVRRRLAGMRLPPPAPGDLVGFLARLPELLVVRLPVRKGLSYLNRVAARYRPEARPDPGGAQVAAQREPDLPRPGLRGWGRLAARGLTRARRLPPAPAAAVSPTAAS